MKNYWFYIEPYTLLFEDKYTILLYNTFTKKAIEFENSQPICDVVKKLKNDESMYCVSISDAELKHAKTYDFIKTVRGSYSGDIVEIDENKKKPVIFSPKLRLKNMVSKDIYYQSGEGIMNYLQEITIYINSACKQNCNTCRINYQQFNYCTKSKDNNLSPESVDKILSEIGASGISHINITGGDILLHPHLDEIIKRLNNISLKKTYHIYFRNIKDNGHIEKLSDSNLNILIDNLSDDLSDDIEIINKVIKIAKNVEFTFIITSEDDYNKQEIIVNRLKIDNVNIKPLYTGENISFFEQNIFLTKDEILNAELSKKNVFAHQVLNTYDFGKITVMPDGNIYANINHKPIGKINDDLKELVHKELEEGVSWRRIRNMKPCCDCVYQWLCPSPSSYELAIGKPNLCHLKP